MCGCSGGACVVALGGGHAWLLCGGACMVALGGACVAALGVGGWGACVVAWGVCMGYDEIRRYVQ